MSLADRINALPTTNAGENLRKAQVLDLAKHAVEVKSDAPDAHDNELERLAYAAIDTAWNLLNEYAVRVTLQEIREEAERVGADFPSDTGLFREARESGDPDAPTSYRDLYPGDYDDRLALSGFFAALLVKADEAVRLAAEDVQREEDLVEELIVSDADILKFLEGNE